MTHTNQDFELLWEAYTYPSDEEEKDIDNEDVKEDDEDEDEPVEEGLIDRAKATGSALKGAAGDVASNVGRGARNVGRTVTGANKSTFEKGKDVKGQYADRKTHRIVQSHYKKLKNTLSDFATDLVKMGITDEDTAERIASEAQQAFLSSPELKKYTKNKAI